MIPAPVRFAALAALLSSPAWAQETPAAPRPTPEPGSISMTIDDNGMRISATPEASEVERMRAEMTRLQAEMDTLRRELRSQSDGVRQVGTPEDVEALEDNRDSDDAEDLEAALPGLPPIPPAPPGVEAMPPIPPVPPPPPTGPIEDRVAYGQAVHVFKGEVVNDVASFGGPVIVEGHVLGDVASFGGPIDLRPGAIVEGDAQSFGGMVYVAEGAELHGDRINFAGSDSFGSGDEGEDHDYHPSFMRRAYNKLVFLLSLAGAGVLVVGLFPKRVAKVAEDIGEHPIRSAVVGTLGSIVVSVVGLLFAITILGLPLSFVLFGLLGIAWLLGFVALCQAVGDRLPFEQKPHGRWIAFLVGVLLVSFVGALPFVGWVAVIGISVVGVGAALSTRFGIA